MRQPQHRNRARMRTRRQPNPVNKVYESNGPDVKVRGTPQQIVDKYMQLGRDALASGDAVKAENYFQHAEHYLRIITAAQEQMQARRQQQEQRRQEVAERRKGNGAAPSEAVAGAAGAADGNADVADAAEVAVDPASQPQPEVAEVVVVLPTEAHAGQAAVAEDAGQPPEEADGESDTEAAATAWEGEPPSFLARPAATDENAEETVAEAASETAADASGETVEEEAATGARKTTRRRRTTRTKKGNGDASRVAGDTAKATGDQPPAADNA